MLYAQKGKSMFEWVEIGYMHRRFENSVMVSYCVCTYQFRLPRTTRAPAKFSPEPLNFRPDNRIFHKTIKIIKKNPDVRTIFRHDARALAFQTNESPRNAMTLRESQSHFENRK